MNKLSFALLMQVVLLVLISCVSNSEGKRKKTTDQNAMDDRARELQDELAMGREVAAKLMGTYGDLNERKKSLEYLNLVVQSLAEKAGRPEIIYRVGILDTDQVNAFATPGGYILITKGLLKIIQNEQELAGVLAHEMGHINHRHLYKEIAPKREISTGETLSRFLSRGGANVSFAFGQAVTKGVKTLLDEGLKPELEYEADQSGIEYAWATGYDPRHFRVFMERLAKSNKLDTKNLLKTHPSFSNRLNKIDLQLKNVGLTDPTPELSNSTMINRFTVLATQK